MYLSQNSTVFVQCKGATKGLRIDVLDKNVTRRNRLAKVLTPCERGNNLNSPQP